MGRNELVGSRVITGGVVRVLEDILIWLACSYPGTWRMMCRNEFVGSRVITVGVVRTPPTRMPPSALNDLEKRATSH